MHIIAGTEPIVLFWYYINTITCISTQTKKAREKTRLASTHQYSLTQGLLNSSTHSCSTVALTLVDCPHVHPEAWHSLSVCVYVHVNIDTLFYELRTLLVFLFDVSDNI